MRNKSFIHRGAVLAVVSILHQSHAEPRVPLPALPSSAMGLYHNRFDEAYWQGKQRSETVQTEVGLLVQSWSGYALQRTGKSVTPFVVPAMGERGQLNVACDFGSVGFWFKPYWTSAAVKTGTEPGVPARLIDLVVIGAKDAAVGWSLQVSANGNELLLVGAGGEVVLKSEIAWSAGEWHWVVLNYGERGTALYVDEAWVAEGDVTVALPPKLTALVLGSSLLGDETAGGEFEDFYCYRKQMTALQPGFGYAGVKKHTLQGPVSDEDVAALAKRRAERKALREAQALLEEESGGGMMMRMMTTTVECVTNSPLYITNTGCAYIANQGWTVTFDVQGTNSPADIFSTTNLSGGTNAIWVWLERGPSCATYQYTNQSSSQSYYILGSLQDSDNDGLTDAYEKLVSKTSPTNPDTDGDGWLDGEEIENGTDPTVVDQPFRVRISRPKNNSVIP